MSGLGQLQKKRNKLAEKSEQSQLLQLGPLRLHQAIALQSQPERCRQEERQVEEDTSSRSKPGILTGMLTRTRGALCLCSKIVRVTSCTNTGSLRRATDRASDSREKSRGEALASRRIRPGLTTHTHSETAPLPRPLRTSLGLAVRG